MIKSVKSSRIMTSIDSTIPPPEELLKYLPTYRVVVCSICQYAIQPSAISGHLKDIHNLYRIQRRPYAQHVSQLNLNKPPDVIDAKIETFPVPFLQMQDGLQCLTEGCGHLCVSGNRMKSHYLAVHGRQGDGAADWKEVPLQTFFRGNLLRYFTGIPPNQSAICTSVLAPSPKQEELLPDPINDRQLPGFQLALPLTEASLLHHYITSTCFTISTPFTITLWRETVPTISRTQPFLYHGLLALTAMHLFHTTSNPSHALVAAHHSHIAIPLFRHAIDNVTKDNCEAVLTFMHFLVLHTFAAEKDKAHLFLPPDSDESDQKEQEPHWVQGVGIENDPRLPPWLYFLRSSCILLCDVWDTIEFGALNQMGSQWDTPIPLATSASESPHTISYMRYFDTLIPSTSNIDPSSDTDLLWDEKIVKIYKEAAESLSSALTIALHSISLPSQETNGELFTLWLALRSWPVELSPTFLSLFSTHRKPHPAALILLAHYCLVLRRLDGFWYFRGGARGLLGSVLRRLGEKWKGSVEWPIREIFGDMLQGKE